MSEVLEKLGESAKKAIEKTRDVADYIVEKAPELSRGMAMVTVSAVAVAIPTLALAAVFPSIVSFYAFLVPVISIFMQLSISIIIISLVIGVAKRLI